MRRILYVAAALLVNEKREILLTQRPAGKSLAGLWEFPGGKIEAGEKPVDSIVRELLEEINITVMPQDCHPLTFVEYDYEDMTVFMPLYLIKKWQGTIEPLEEQEYAWVGLDKLADYPVPPADEAVIAQMPELLARNL